MGEQKFINPDNEKQTIEISSCKLDKKIEDYESRNNRIPEVDEFYVDLGMQYRLAKVLNSKTKSFKNEWWTYWRNDKKFEFKKKKRIFSW